jgi:hypothetical protein
MPEANTNNGPVDITHIWPYSKQLNADAKPISDERESDVWDELRDLTFDEDVRGDIAFLTHEEDIVCANGEWGSNHNVTCTTLIEKFQEDLVVNNRFSFFAQREVEQEIHNPATEEIVFTSRTAAQIGTNEPGRAVTIPAKSARVETRKKRVPVHLGSKLDALAVIEKYRSHEMAALVLWHPEFNPYGSEHYLKHLPMVHSKCPDLPIYIFHWDYREDKWGVEREGRTGGSLWDTQSEMTDEKELQAVIEHVTNVQENTWIFGPPKQGKTWIMLCIVKALLTGEPLFGVSRLRVPHPSKRVIYLCPEAGRTGLRKRLKMLGLMGHLYDPITNPEGRLYLRSLSKGPKLSLNDSQLLELVKDADIFIDTAVRYVEGDENNATDVKDMTEQILNLIALGARSMWVAHHSGKSFASATDITLENCARGSTEFAASLTNAIGIVQLDKDKNLIHFHFIDGRDMDEPVQDMHLLGRPYLSTTGNFQVTENVERFKGRNPKKGRPADPDKQAKIDLAKSIDGSLQEKADAVYEKFGTKHAKSTVSEWLKDFDEDKQP